MQKLSKPWHTVRCRQWRA